MKLLRAWNTLVFLSFRRLLWSVNTLMIMFPMLAVMVVALQQRSRLSEMASEHFPTAFETFSMWFVLPFFSSFLVPICALAYGTTSVGGDREDRTLLFLLCRPIPRSMILLAKWTASLPIAVGVVVLGFFLFSHLAGEAGRLTFHAYLPAIVFSTLAYVGLFHLFAVLFRHSTIVALAYTLFMEFFIGNMPGIIKQASVSYYGKSMIYSAGLEHGLTPPDPSLFEPLTYAGACGVLVLIALGGLSASLIVFQKREYRDLS